MLIEVTAGVIPGQPMPGYTKVFTMDSDEWEESGSEELGQLNLFQGIKREAQSYADELANPAMLNWVRTEWIWL